MINYCTSCGAPMRPVDIRCRYCDMPVPPDRPLTENDRTRIALFIKIADSLLYEKNWEICCRLSLLFFLTHACAALASVLLIFFTSGSLAVTGICAALHTALVMTLYYQQFAFFEHYVSHDLMYKGQLLPGIARFLQAFNYSGARWQAVFIELRDAGEIIGLAMAVKDSSPKPGQDTTDAFLTNLLGKLTAYRLRSPRIIDTLGISGLSYIILLTVPLYYVLFSPYWIPLLWVTPAFACLLWLTARTLGPGFEAYFPSFERRFIDRELVPLVRDYCTAVQMPAGELLNRARENSEEAISVLLPPLIGKAVPPEVIPER